jgi:general secretion pathway protein L
VGIEISDRQVNIVYLKGSLKGTNLAAASALSMDPGKPQDDRQADIVHFINGFFQAEKVGAADIFIAVPGRHAILREIEFPLAVKENLRATLSYEIEKYIPVSMDDIYFDYHITAEHTEEETFKILLVAFKKEILDAYLTIAAQIDKGVSGIGIVPAALANYFLYHQESPSEPVVLYYTSDSGPEAVVVKDRAMVYAKTIDASDDPSSEESDSTGAHLLRLRDGFCGDSQSAALLLYGIPAMDERFSSLSGKFAKIAAGTTHAASRPEGFIPAFGMALCGISKGMVDINLMPVGLRKKPDKTGVYVMALLMALLVVAGGIWAGSHLITQRRIIHNIDAELARLRAEASEIEQIQSNTLEMKTNLEYMQSLRPGNVFTMEILNELSTMIPSDAWLTELKLTGDKLHLYGLAASATGLISLLEKSPFFENVEFISTIRKDRDGREIFRIGCTLQNAKQGG